MRGMETVSKVTRSLNGRDKDERPSGELEVSKPVECDISHLFFYAVFGRQEGHPVCKKLGVGMLVSGNDLTGALHVL